MSNQHVPLKVLVLVRSAFTSQSVFPFASRSGASNERLSYHPCCASSLNYQLPGPQSQSFGSSECYNCMVLSRDLWKSTRSPDMLAHVARLTPRNPGCSILFRTQAGKFGVGCGMHQSRSALWAISPLPRCQSSDTCATTQPRHGSTTTLENRILRAEPQPASVHNILN